MDVVAKRKNSVSAATPTSYPFYTTATLLAKLTQFFTATLHTSNFQIYIIKCKKLSYSLKKNGYSCSQLRDIHPLHNRMIKRCELFC